MHINTHSLYINQSTSARTTKYTPKHSKTTPKTNKYALLTLHSSVWHVEYALKYGQIHFEQGTTCWNMLKTHYMHHWWVWHVEYALCKYSKYGQNTKCTPNTCPNMALIVNSTETAIMTKYILYAMLHICREICCPDRSRAAQGGVVKSTSWWRTVHNPVHWGPNALQNEAGAGSCTGKMHSKYMSKYGLDRKLYWNCKYDQIYTICNVAHLSWNVLPADGLKHTLWHSLYIIRSIGAQMQSGAGSCTGKMHSKYMLQMALIVNTTESAKRGRNILYATMYKTTPNMALIVNTTESANTPRNVLYAQHQIRVTLCY